MKLSVKNVKFLTILFALGLALTACDDEDKRRIDPFDPPEEFEAVDCSAANALSTIPMKNYLGNAENIHPKVLYFKKKWKGYHYWMAYTPYPKGATADENPCIAASQDGIEWITPAGLTNPLAGAPEGGYNSDTHLVYNRYNNTLECWWREFKSSTKSDRILRRISSDGVNWGPEKCVMDWGRPSYMRMSPAVDMTEKGTYRMITCTGNALDIQYGKEAEDGTIAWDEATRISREGWGELRPWHQDFIEAPDGTLELVVCGWYPNITDNNSADLYYARLDPRDNSITSPMPILRRNNDASAFDYRAIYRSSIVRTDKEYRIYYSCIDDGWHRHMAMTSGPSPIKLTGK